MFPPPSTAAQSVPAVMPRLPGVERVPATAQPPRMPLVAATGGLVVTVPTVVGGAVPMTTVPPRGGGGGPGLSCAVPPVPRLTLMPEPYRSTLVLLKDWTL